jgi:hypothetical protein
MNESVLDKVKALLSKTVENGATQEEAANAARIAQQLITKYRLELVEFDTSRLDDEISARHRPLYEGQKVVHWRSDLAHWICQVNSCRLIYRKKENLIALSVVGRAGDVEIVRYLFEHLSREIDRLCVQQLEDGKGSGKRFTNSFKHGAVSMIVKRLRAAHKATLAQARINNRTTAIVKLDQRDAEVDAWMHKNLKMQERGASTRRTFDVTGYQAGRTAGAAIAINKGLAENGHESPKAIKRGVKCNRCGARGHTTKPLGEEIPCVWGGCNGTMGVYHD